MRDQTLIRLVTILGGSIISTLALSLIAMPGTSPNHYHAMAAAMVLWACIAFILATLLYVSVTKSPD